MHAGSARKQPVLLLLQKRQHSQGRGGDGRYFWVVRESESVAKRVYVRRGDMRPTAEHEYDRGRISLSLESEVYAGQEGDVSGVESAPTTPAADNDSLADAVERNAESDIFEIVNIFGGAGGGRRQGNVGHTEQERRRERVGVRRREKIRGRCDRV
jgi:hypothetical protein